MNTIEPMKRGWRLHDWLGYRVAEGKSELIDAQYWRFKRLKLLENNDLACVFLDARSAADLKEQSYAKYDASSSRLDAVAKAKQGYNWDDDLELIQVIVNGSPMSFVCGPEETIGDLRSGCLLIYQPVTANYDPSDWRVHDADGNQLDPASMAADFKQPIHISLPPWIGG